MFCFLIDPTGWVEIDGESFAPGLFLWNSEVGRRSLGIETFWFQSVCRNHIVWDAMNVIEFTRKHTAGVRNALDEVKGIVQSLVRRRDARRDGFALVIRSAMTTSLGSDRDEVVKRLSENGILKSVGERAVELARERGTLTIFSVVDALTKISGTITNAGDRVVADQKAARILSLAV